MKRTTILIPQDLRTRAGLHAQHMGISFGELVRLSLDAYLSNPSSAARKDSLFSDDEVFEGEVPYNLSTAHDGYLYGEDD